MQSEKPVGPFFLVDLEADDPYISSILPAAFMFPSEVDEATSHHIGKCSMSNSPTGTPLTRDDLLALPGGQGLLDEFMAGDNRRRDRQDIPALIKTLRECLEDPGLSGDDIRARIAECEAVLADLND